MKKLSQTKKNQLIIVLLVTAALIAAVYFLLISPQNDNNHALARSTADKMAELEKMKTAIKQATVTSNQLETVSAQLANAESDIATGDVYVWTYDMIRRFKTNYNVDIPVIGQPSVSDVDILPNFPYKQLRVSINGTAYYQDLGKFVADFENKFPHTRLVNLTVESADSTGANEKLSFHMDIVALVKPNS